MKQGVVIVTGSSGLIGRRVCQRLSAEFTVLAFDRPGPPHPPPEVVAIDVDLSSDEGVAHAFERVRRDYGTRIASVIHLAAYYDFSGEPSPLYDSITVEGTSRLLKALQSFQVEQFVFSSTMLVHTPQNPPNRIAENSPIAATWPYPDSKVKTEQRIHEERGSIPAVLLRISGVYDDNGNSIPLAHQIQRIYERDFTSHFFPGDMSHGQSFVHLDDTVDLIEKAVLKRKELPPEIAFVAGEPDTVSYAYLQAELGRLIHGHPWRTWTISKPIAKFGARFQKSFIKPWMIDRADDHYALDITQARRILAWEPKRSLRETLPRMVAALKRNPAAWYKAHDLE